MIEMVNFSFIPLDKSRVRPELKEDFLSIGQIMKWDYTDDQGRYTGLIVVGEASGRRGFRTTAKVTIDTSTRTLPTQKIRELSRRVSNEFVARKFFLGQKASNSTLRI